VYVEKIQPRLAGVPILRIARLLGASNGYAGDIRKGHRPHPRHWLALAQLVGIAPTG